MQPLVVVITCPVPTVHVTLVVGTRPEAIKMGPVLRALENLGLRCILLCTGQHAQLDLPGCGIDRAVVATLPLDPRKLSADAMCVRIATLAGEWIDQVRPKLVLVQGDTNSAFGAALAARARGVPIGHVEAGLRTHDLLDPYPEERNRVEIDAAADLLFAPTEGAVRNLLKEDVPGRVFLTGNSGIDAVVDAAGEHVGLPVPPVPMILATMHRRENRGRGVLALADALRRIGAEASVSFVVPLPVNAQARAEITAALSGLAGCTLLNPQSYRDMIGLIRRSWLVLTDSGGLQEECPVLGRPVLVMRAGTERAEAIASGNAMLVGTDPRRIALETLRLLRDREHYDRMSLPAFPFGRPGASEEIARIVAGFLQAPASAPLGVALQALELDPSIAAA